MQRTARWLMLLLTLTVLIPIAASAAPPEQRFRGRENDRVTVDGRVRDMRHERDGYRVYLEQRGDSFWVPDRAIRSHQRDFRIGAWIRLGGVFRGGTIFVDIIDWPDAPRGYETWHREVIRGWIVRIDYAHESLLLRDERTGRTIRADLRHCEDDVVHERYQRGDFIRLTGGWTRDGDFDVDHLDRARERR